MMNTVKAIRIYLGLNATPYADLLMTNGVVEHVQWNAPEERKGFIITGYTLFYDERPKRKWEDWIHKG